MSWSRKYLPIFLILAFALSGLVYALAWKADASPALDDQAEEHAIREALEGAYAALAYAGETGDVSRLPEAFLDTPDYQPPDAVRQNVEWVFGAEKARRAGYLTSLQAKYLATSRAVNDLRAAEEKARAEGRELTTEELQQVIQANHGIMPPSGTYRSPSRVAQLSFEKIQISGDRASVYYDDGAAYQRATLARVDGKWFVTNIEALQIHF